MPYLTVVICFILRCLATKALFTRRRLRLPNTVNILDLLQHVNSEQQHFFSPDRFFPLYVNPKVSLLILRHC